MSNNNEETEETEEEKALLKRKPNKIIEVRHTMEKVKGESELEKTKKSLKEKTDILALIALKEFEGEKEKILELVPSDKKEAIDKFITDVDKLEAMKATLGLTNPEEETETPTAPSGKATLGIRTPSETPSFSLDKGYDDVVIQRLHDWYAIVDPKNKESSESNRKKAQRNIEQFIGIIRQGLKQRKASGKRDYVYPKRFTWNCQNCNKVNQQNSRPESGIPCIHCGFKFGIDPTPTNPYV